MVKVKASSESYSSEWLFSVIASGKGNGEIGHQGVCKVIFTSWWDEHAVDRPVHHRDTDSTALHGQSPLRDIHKSAKGSYFSDKYQSIWVKASYKISGTPPLYIFSLVNWCEIKRNFSTSSFSFTNEMEVNTIFRHFGERNI